jgi:hypothetical protein
MAIPLLIVFEAGNDQLIQWGPLVTGPTANNPSPTYVDDASGTATLLDPNGNPVPGATGLSFTYVTSSTGIYQAQIVGSSFNPAPGSGYTLQVRLTSGSAGAGFWTVPATVAVRSTA